VLRPDHIYSFSGGSHTQTRLRVNAARLLSIQVGLPQILVSDEQIGPDQAAWSTAFLKRPVPGPIWVGRTNIVGDGQASSKTHGGAEKAVCVYPWEHYSYWQRELNLPKLPFGAFGENFTVHGQLEGQSCIGDTIGFGEAILQISQPRPPCWRLSRFWQRKEFAERMEETGRTGWYCRVIREGYANAGTAIELLERPCPEWTVAHANHLLYCDRPNVDQMSALASCSLLSQSWYESLLKRKAKLTESGGPIQ
jgi:MOSC domain-containing protein YiiM